MIRIFESLDDNFDLDPVAYTYIKEYTKESLIQIDEYFESIKDNYTVRDLSLIHI